VNVDVVVFSSELRMGLGVVIRDHSKNLKLSCSKSVAGVTSPELAEAIAIRRALNLSKDNGFSDIILASGW
jgi:hypothetical protein